MDCGLHYCNDALAAFICYGLDAKQKFTSVYELMFKGQLKAIFIKSLCKVVRIYWNILLTFSLNGCSKSENWQTKTCLGFDQRPKDVKQQSPEQRISPLAESVSFPGNATARNSIFYTPCLLSSRSRGHNRTSKRKKKVFHYKSFNESPSSKLSAQIGSKHERRRCEENNVAAVIKEGKMENSCFFILTKVEVVLC